MRRASQHAPANAIFVVAAAEALPPELDGMVTQVSIAFPWGSLLRGLIDPSPAMLDGLRRVLVAGGRLTALLSVTDRDGGTPLGASSIDPPAYARASLTVVDWRRASGAEIAASDSSWAKRLGAGESRPVWLLAARSRPNVAATDS